MFVVSEQAGHGLQVFDLKRLRNAPSGYTTFAETAQYAGFGNSHNLNINERTGYAYAVGTSTCEGGLHIVDIRNPTSPTFAGCFQEHGYIHDTQCVTYKGPDREHRGREICFNANAQVHHDPPPDADPITNALSIVDVTDKSNPVVLSRTEYPNDGYSHQGWLVPGQKYFLHGDELDELTHGINTTTRIWDVRDLDDPEMILEWQNDTTSIDHNMYTEGRLVYQSNYTSGLRILDTSRVSKPDLRELAFFDVHPENDNPTFEGRTWSNYPYFAQKKIVVASTMDRGLFVLRTQVGGGGKPLAGRSEPPTRRAPPRGALRYARMTTGVPSGFERSIRSTWRFSTRRQPYEAAFPIDPGAFVPWIAIGPPCVQPVRTGEKALIPIAPGPKGPAGSGASSRWFT